MNKEELLNSLPRIKLQAEAKKLGIKANLSSARIIEEILRLSPPGATTDIVCISEPMEMHSEKKELLINQSDGCHTAGDIVIPEYWGSELEGAINPGAVFDAKYGVQRYLTIATISEPYIMTLARKCGVSFITREGVAEIKRTLIREMSRLCDALVSNKSTTSERFELVDAQNACRIAGVPILGASVLYSPPHDQQYFTDEYTQTKLNDPENQWPAHWNLFCAALTYPSEKEMIYSMLYMYKLVEKGRAYATQRDNVVPMACNKLNEDVFRVMLSYLLPRQQTSNTVAYSRRLFSDDHDMSDNWSECVCYDTLDEALNNGVNILEDFDNHTGTTFLHAQAVKNRAEDCQRMIDMGMPVDVLNGVMFENGDGWGELEYVGFTPLHFACSNGCVEAARVLLMNGASSKIRASWDGGHFIPVIKRGEDYWYTSNNTPLHQAARGNHVDIIHLLLNGPDDEASAYAASKGINIDNTWVPDIEEARPTETLYDTHSEHSISLTPLAMALIFDNLEAVLALLSHGANLNNISVPNHPARKMLMRRIINYNAGSISKFLRSNLAAMGDPRWGDFNKAITRCDDDDNNANDVEEEDPWDQEDFDEYQVPVGDAKVPLIDSEDKQGYLSAEECPLAYRIVQILSEVNPTLRMSRNSQIVMSELYTHFVDNIIKLCGDTLHPDGVRKAVSSMLPGQLTVYALKELEKIPTVEIVESFRDYVIRMWPNVIVHPSFGEEGMSFCLLIVEYLMAEIIELSGNCANDQHLRCIHPLHISFACGNDDELRPLTKAFCFGNIFGGNDNIVTIPTHQCRFLLNSITSSKVQKHDEFCSQEWVTKKRLTNYPTENEMIMQEIRHFFKRLNNYISPIIPSHAFRALLQAHCARYDVMKRQVLSDEVSLVIQLACEKTLVDTVWAAVQAMRTVTEPKYDAANRCEYEGDITELGSTEMDVSADAVRIAYASMLDEVNKEHKEGEVMELG